MAAPRACGRKLRGFRYGVGPAVGGGRKTEGTMRGSEILGEGRLERQFLSRNYEIPNTSSLRGI